MPYTAPKVFYSATINGTYTEFTQVQSINITRGRQRFTDPFVASQCVIELIPANSYSPALEIGQFLDIRLTNSSASPAYFNGRITDIERRYGIPYNVANTIAAPADRITLTVTGGTGVLGSQMFAGTGNSWGVSDVISGVAQPIGNTYGVDSANPGPSGIKASAQTVADGTPIMDAINQCLRTAQWSVDDADRARSASGGYSYSVQWFPTSQTGTTVTFTDAGGAGFKYNDIQYVSSVQQTFSTIVVEPAGLAPQASTSGTFRNAYSFTTFDETTTQAANLAAYVQLVNNQTTPVPFAISTSSVLTDTAQTLAELTTYPVGTGATITFRGTTVNAVIQGWSFGFYPDHCNVTAFMSPSLGTPFTLDSTSFGVLDTNRLGYP